jgi:hypothetical protein
MKTTKALEAFLDWELRVLWTNPVLLSPNPDDVVYAIKITCKMAREVWKWDEEDIQQALKYADDHISKEPEDWDLEMLKKAVAEDWDLEKIYQAMEARERQVYGSDN